MNKKKIVTFPKSKLLSIVCNNLWFALLLTGVVLTSVLYTCKGTVDKEKPVAFKVVAFGGTVTDGTTAKLDVFHDCLKWGTNTVNKVRKTQTWWSITERILTDWVDGGVKIIDAGTAGNTAAAGLARLEDDVLSFSPDYVLVMFGLDDALAGETTENFQENLEKIVNRLNEENVKPVLTTPPPISDRMITKCTNSELQQRQAHLSALVDIIRSLATQKSLVLIDFNQYFIDNRFAYAHLFEGWLPDGVAQSAMAPFVAGEFLPLMGVNNYPNPTLCDFRKAYKDSSGDLSWKHNAFTDLTFFDGQFYLTFRNGAGHCPPPPPSGRVIVLKSKDGMYWEREATLIIPGVVHQADPKFLHVDGSLFVYTLTLGDTMGNSKRRMTYGFERLAPGKWSKLFECGECSFWRPKKWRDQYVVAPYGWAKKDAAVKLLTSSDGRTWEEKSTILPYETGGNETDLFIENDTLIAYARCGEGNNHEMLISTYFPEENRWESVTTGRLIHAPCVFKVRDKIMVTGRYCSQSDDGFRDLRKDWNAFTSGDDDKMDKADPARVEAYHHGLRTGVFMLDGAKPRLLLELLSAGDSSYPGVVQHGDEYVISDYSMHEYYPIIRKPGDWNTPCDIYVSRVHFGK